MKKLQPKYSIFMGLSLAFMILLNSCASSVKTTSCPSFKNKKTTKIQFAKLDLFKKNKRKAPAKVNTTVEIKTQKQTAQLIVPLHKLNAPTLAVNRVEEQLETVQMMPASTTFSIDNLLNPVQAVKKSLQVNSSNNDNQPVLETVSTTNQLILESTVKESLVPPVLVETLTKKEKKELRKELRQELKKELKLKKKAAHDGPGGKSQLVALLLAIFIGGLGIHRFYLGYTGIGIAQIFTLGGLGIWTLIDIIRIATGDLGPKDGPYDETL